MRCEGAEDENGNGWMPSAKCARRSASAPQGAVVKAGGPILFQASMERFFPRGDGISESSGPTRAATVPMSTSWSGGVVDALGLAKIGGDSERGGYQRIIHRVSPGMMKAHYQEKANLWPLAVQPRPIVAVGREKGRRRGVERRDQSLVVVNAAFEEHDLRPSRAHLELPARWPGRRVSFQATH